MELETLNGVTREELLSRLDLTDENKPIWKDFEYLYRISAVRLHCKEVGFVAEFKQEIIIDTNKYKCNNIFINIRRS